MRALQGEVGTSDATLEPRFNPGSRSTIATEGRAGGGVSGQSLAGWTLGSGQVGVAG